MRSLLCAVFVAVALSGCSTGEVGSSRRLPEGWKAYEAMGGYVVYVIPVTMDDGTRCVAVNKNGGGGAGITCDWSSTK